MKVPFVKVPVQRGTVTLSDFTKKLQRDIVRACLRNAEVWDGEFSKTDEANAFLSALSIAMIGLEEQWKLPFGTVEGFILATREYREILKAENK